MKTSIDLKSGCWWCGVLVCVFLLVCLFFLGGVDSVSLRDCGSLWGFCGFFCVYVCLVWVG